MPSLSPIILYMRWQPPGLSISVEVFTELYLPTEVKQEELEEQTIIKVALGYYIFGHTQTGSIELRYSSILFFITFNPTTMWFTLNVADSMGLDACINMWASLVAQWKEFTCQCKRRRFNPWVRRIPWRRKWQPTPVFLPGKSMGLQKSRTRLND